MVAPLILELAECLQNFSSQTQTYTWSPAVGNADTSVKLRSCSAVSQHPVLVTVVMHPIFYVSIFLNLRKKLRETYRSHRQDIHPTSPTSLQKPFDSHIFAATENC